MTSPGSVAVTNSLLDLYRVLVDLTWAVTGPRPEEPPQTVAASPWHNMYVQVGDGLADDIVDGYERPLRLECLDQRASKALRAG